MEVRGSVDSVDSVAIRKGIQRLCPDPLPRFTTSVDNKDYHSRFRQTIMIAWRKS